MKISRLLMGIFLATTLFFGGCKPKDADVKASVEEKLKANAETASTMVMVSDGVATLSGELSNDNAKAESEKIASGVKGVKSVINNISVTPAIVTPSFTAPVIAADDALTTGIKDATKDFPTVNALVNDGVVSLTGSISKASLPKLMQSISALRPKKIDNKLTVK